MNIGQAMTRMQENPGLKMWMPLHYRSWEYLYFDAEKNMFCIETGEEWDVDRSIACNELDNYADYNPENRFGS